MHKAHPLAWQAEPTDFALTHCMQCAGGFTRCGTDAKVIICLLDQEPVFPNMISCDRFEPREKEKPPVPKRAPYRMPRPPAR